MSADLALRLHPPRLPEAFAALGWDDALAAFGIGLLLAALILTLAGPALRRRESPPSLARRFAEAAALPPEERLLALVRLLESRGGRLSEAERAALYAGAPLDPAALEARIRAGRGA